LATVTSVPPFEPPLELVVVPELDLFELPHELATSARAASIEAETRNLRFTTTSRSTTPAQYYRRKVGDGC
jgi:hypothetical protein